MINSNYFILKNNSSLLKDYILFYIKLIPTSLILMLMTLFHYYFSLSYYIILKILDFSIIIFLVLLNN